MKRYVLPLLIVLLPVAIYALWEWTPRTVPPERASELYRQYASNPHVTASFLKDFRVNDTVTVDVTLLEAKDDEGWEELREMTGGFPLTDYELKQLRKGIDVVMTWLTDDDTMKPKPNIEPVGNYFCVMSNLERRILACHIETEEQYRNIDLHYINQLKTKKQ